MLHHLGACEDCGSFADFFPLPAVTAVLHVARLIIGQLSARHKFRMGLG